MPTRRQFLVLVGSGAALGAAAVTGIATLAGDEDQGDGFPVIRYGAERCAQCGMIIDEVRFAAARSGPGKTSRHFDDIGCLVMDTVEHPPASDGVRLFVHDYETERWLDAESASYVIAAAIRSPMAYGLAGFSEKAAAERQASQSGGRTYSWDQLPENLPRKHHS
jgi:copper chaperone NosL